LRFHRQAQPESQLDRQKKRSLLRFLIYVLPKRFKIALSNSGSQIFAKRVSKFSFRHRPIHLLTACAKTKGQCQERFVEGLGQNPRQPANGYDYKTAFAFLQPARERTEPGPGTKPLSAIFWYKSNTLQAMAAAHAPKQGNFDSSGCSNLTGHREY
jgi:hypothetical protein